MVFPNYIIGLHFGGIEKEKDIDFSFNLATSFDSILNHINKQNEIIEQDKIKQNKLNFSFNKSNLQDIMNILNNSDNEKKFNNIIYFNSNIDFLSNINQDIDDFEKVTPGAFIFCNNMNSFKLIREEILLKSKKDKRFIFNIITTGSQCDNVMKFLDIDSKFKSCIAHLCIYIDHKIWDFLKSKYDSIYDVVSSKEGVINYIKKYCSKEIKTYNITKVITLKNYLEKYKDIHSKISQFYGDLSPETYKDNIKKMRLLIDQEDKDYKLICHDKNKILYGFLTFDISKDIEALDKLIIREYTKNSIYADLNKWLRNPNFNSFEVVAYFAVRLMYSLNNYAKQKGKYYDLDKTEVFRGMKLPYSEILVYERAKGKIIILPAFTTTYQDLRFAEKYSGRRDTKSLYESNLKFSVIFMINNNIKKNWISNGIRIEEISTFKKEKEILYQPFSFYYVRDVIIDLENYKADIYLETIGKKEILEEKIKIGKKIKYNEQEKIMEGK